MTYPTLPEAVAMAQQMARFAKDQMPEPCAFEVVKTRKGFDVQPFGMHALFKTQTLVHVEPIPQE